MRRLLWNNPVLLRELQERVLSRRTVIVITLWVGVLCLVTGLYYASEATNAFRGGFDNNILGLANVGQNMFDWLLFFMIGLVLFLVPGVTAASIAGERERQTLLPMQVTLLRPIDIVVGKIAASLVFVLMLIAVTLPVLAFAYVIGGVTIGEVFTSLAMLAFSATAVACMTVACSALVRRVPAAIVTAYGLVLVLAVGSLAVYGIASAIDANRGFDQDRPPLAILAVNPVVALAQVSDSAPQNDFFFGNNVDTPMGVMRELIADNRRRAGFFLVEDRFAGEFGVIVEPPMPVPVPAPPIAIPVPPPLPLVPTPTPAVDQDTEGALDPDTLGPDTVEPDTLGPDTLGPDTLDPDTVEPAVPVPVIPVSAPTPAPALPADLVAEVEAAQAAAEAAVAGAADEAVVLFQPEQPPFQVPEQPSEAMSFVLQYLIAMTGLSAIAVWVATRRIRTPAEVER